MLLNHFEHQAQVKKFCITLSILMQEYVCGEVFCAMKCNSGQHLSGMELFFNHTAF